MASVLAITGPVIAAAGALGALVRWYVVDRRKSVIEAKVTEETLSSEVDLHDTGARDARLIYVQRQVDMERAFHVQQIADRDAEIARQRSELAHRDEIIASLLRDVDRLQAQLRVMGGELTAVRTQLTALTSQKDTP